MTRTHKHLDDAFAEFNITDITVNVFPLEICDEFGYCEDASYWRAFLSRDQIISAERMWSGEGDTFEEAIWDALNNKGPIKQSRFEAWDDDGRDI